MGALTLDPPKCMTADDQLLIDYRRHLLAAGRGAGTVNQRIYHLKNLRVMVPNLLTATTEDLERYLASRRRTHAAESRKAMRSTFRSFYKWARQTERIARDPSEMLDPIYIPRDVGRRAPDEAVSMALELATLPEKAMILLGRLACLRLGEITHLHTNAREGDTLRVLGKGEKTRIVPIHPDLLEVLQRLENLQGEGYYFPGRWGGCMNEQSVYATIKRRLGYNPHSLRHAGATAAYKGTGDLRAVQELLGHASVATTQRYIHVDLDQVRAAANATSIGGMHDRPSPLERVTFTPQSVSRGGRE